MDTTQEKLSFSAFAESIGLTMTADSMVRERSEAAEHWWCFRAAVQKARALHGCARVILIVELGEKIEGGTS